MSDDASKCHAPVHPVCSCETSVGRTGGEQVLHLSNTCASGVTLSHGEIAHELLHTLGFYHEHQRRDRDSYITVEINNVRQSGMW